MYVVLVQQSHCCIIKTGENMSDSLVFAIFNVIVLLLTVIDFHWMQKHNSLTTSAQLSVIWITIGLLFSFVIQYLYGTEHFYEYLSAYFIEKSLSVDNIFVFYLIFSQLKISHAYQHKVLFIGIWSAVLLRMIMIFAVGAILNRFHFIIYIFGLFILYAGITPFIHKEQSDTNYQKILKVAQKLLPIHQGEYHGHFFVKDKGKIFVTSLFVALIIIEFSDIVFAFDSIPALFSITDHTMIIYFSNILAIIGLRSLYGLFAEIADRFIYIKQGVSVILILVGLKMILSDIVHVDAKSSLFVISFILLVSIVLSMKKNVVRG